MNTDIKSLLIRVCGTISYLIVIFFFVTFILFLHNDIKDALKEAWSVSVSFLSALTTLGAAIIAANLFNNWKDQHNKTVEKEMAWDVVHKFDIADIHLSEFQDVFQNFKYRCQFLYEMPDEEFGNLNTELRGIVKSLNGASLNFTAFLESTRKYSVVANNAYFDDANNDVKKINSIIFNTQNDRVHFPSSMNAIEDAIETLKEHVVNIENKCINKILSELKALT